MAARRLARFLQALFLKALFLQVLFLQALLLPAQDSSIHDQPMVSNSPVTRVFIAIAVVLLIAGFIAAGRLVFRSMAGRPRDRKNL